MYVALVLYSFSCIIMPARHDHDDAGILGSSDAESDVESWDEEGTLGLEECLFCPHIASSLETNISHMTTKHSFFLPDAEYICDLEGLIVYLGECC